MAQSHSVSHIAPRITLKPASGVMPREAIRPTAGSTMPSPVEDDDEIVEMAFDDAGQEYSIPRPQRAPTNRMTKTGKPDRRFKGQRDLPDEEVINPDYRRASVGETDDQGNHFTMDGKPDRRFIENRTISDDDAEIMMAEHILARRGIKVPQRN